MKLRRVFLETFTSLSANKLRTGLTILGIVIGVAALMGFRLMENFNRPFLATNVQDFWTRWHISLTSIDWGELSATWLTVCRVRERPHPRRGPL